MAEQVTPQAPDSVRPVILRQGWHDLTFVHWAVAPARVAHYLPKGTEPDTFEGRTYVGLVPFRMTWRGAFLETNIRLYSVDATGLRGVVFRSLDADRLSVVAAARGVFGLPYRWARMQHHQRDDVHTYTSSLRWPGTTASSAVEVRVGEQLEPGPLEHFLTARWGLHVSKGGRTWYLPNEHPAWVLRAAELQRFEDHGLLASVGLGELSERQPDHVAFSAGVPALFGLPTAATRPRRPVRR